MWPMCGGEHYTISNRFKEGYLKSNNNSEGFDLDRWLWNKKKKNWKSKINKIVCISKWLEDKTLKSELFRNTNVKKINCNLDISIWKPINQNVAREILGLPIKKKIFLFVSSNGTGDIRKGFQFVDKTLDKMSYQNKDFEIIILGRGNIKEEKKYNYRIIDRVLDGNPTELRLIYSACDLILAPSTLEAFGQIALEGASCGIPTLAFEKTGIADIVEHKSSGYLSSYMDQVDFERGLNWMLENLEKDKDYFLNNYENKG
jgi:glycosyltransferase involved in cell wall biosynthesis